MLRLLGDIPHQGLLTAERALAQLLRVSDAEDVTAAPQLYEAAWCWWLKAHAAHLLFITAHIRIRWDQHLARLLVFLLSISVTGRRAQYGSPDESVVLVSEAVGCVGFYVRHRKLACLLVCVYIYIYCTFFFLSFRRERSASSYAAVRLYVNRELPKKKKKENKTAKQQKRECEVGRRREKKKKRISSFCDVKRVRRVDKAKGKRVMRSKKETT